MVLIDMNVRRIGYSSRRRVLTKCAVFVERMEGDWREEVRSTKDPVKSMENIGHRINTVTVEP